MLTPNEGYTAGSQSMQFGGVAMRLVCAEVRALFLADAGRELGCNPAALSVRDGQHHAQWQYDRARLLDARQ